MSKILFVVDENRRGGVSVALQDVLLSFQDEECDIDLLVLHDQKEMLQDLPSYVNVIYGTSFFSVIDYNFKQILQTKSLPLIIRKIEVVLGLKTGWICKKIRKERKKILRETYDVEVAFKDGFTAVFTACGDAKKKIHWLHSEYKEVNSNSKYKKLFQKIMPKFDNIVAVSKGVEQQFNSIYHLENKTKVIPNIVWGEAIRKKSTLQQVCFDKSVLNVVMVGRCHPDKGYMRFLESVKSLKAVGQLEGIAFHIIGDGPELVHMQQFIEEENFQREIKLYGAKDNPYGYMSAADCVFLPSFNESFGLVIVEAQVLGTPVVATKNAATSELILHNETGLIVENSDQGVADGIKLMQNAQLLKKFREKLLTYTYDNAEIVKKIKDILEV